MKTSDRTSRCLLPLPTIWTPLVVFRLRASPFGRSMFNVESTIEIVLRRAFAPNSGVRANARRRIEFPSLCSLRSAFSGLWIILAQFLSKLFAIIVHLPMNKRRFFVTLVKEDISEQVEPCRCVRTSRKFLFPDFPDVPRRIIQNPERHQDGRNTFDATHQIVK